MRLVGEVRLAARLFARDLRSGELTLIGVAIALAVAAVTTVGFFADRVRQALDRQANVLLGADLVIGDTRPLAPRFAQEARARGLETSEVLRFPTMVTHGSRTQLAALKAVEANYPLRGEVRVAPRLSEPARRASSAPEPGTVWVDERLYTGLELAPGARIAVGAAELRVAGVVAHEPGVAFGFLSGAPRLLLNRADLPATGLVQPASRIRYELLVAGREEAVAAYRAWVLAHLEPGQRVEGVRDARPAIRGALERAERFLHLVALTSAVLAAAAIALGARRYLQRHLDGCAMMRCLGASAARIARLHLVQFAALGIAASGLGAALGALAQLVLAGAFARVTGAALPPPGAGPALEGAAVGIVLLLAFALPPLAALARVPALRVLRRELGAPQPEGLAAWAGAGAAVAAAVLWRAGELGFGLAVLGWFCGALAAACALAWALMRAAGALRRRGGAWRLALASLHGRPLGTTVQIVALALGIMALLTLTLVRGDLARSWERSLPPDAPNRFLIHIQPEQRAPLAEFLRRHGLGEVEFHPMVRGRLVAINGRTRSAEDYEDERAKQLIAREFNLSWAQRLRADNRIVAGRWWGPSAQRTDQFSVEQGLARTLGIGLGDALAFDLAGTRVTGTVTSLRRVEWDSFNVNFFVLAPPGLLDGQPASYVTSFHLPGERAEMLNGLVRAFPNVVLIDVAQALEHARGMLEQAARAVEFVVLFTLAAGLAVLYAAIAATRDERLHQAAVLRALGASRGRIARAQLAEFATLGAAAGFVAASGAAGLGWFLAHRFLDLDYAPDPSLWAAGVGAGALGVAAAGALGTLRVLRAPPLGVLRELG